MKRKLFTFIAMVFVAMNMFGATVKGYTTEASSSTGLILFKIASIDYEDDHMRLYGTLVGKPHTSDRIDRLTLVMPDGHKLEATDIEGVDMKRWFQWEDSGAIEVEIDFPPCKQLGQFTLESSGPKGDSKSSVVKLK